jgi:L-threonylcarbamoyladenylate synthase
MLARHYAPSKPLRIIDDWSLAANGPAVGVLTLRPITDPGQYGRVEILSTSGSLVEAAANFFAALRRLDASEVETILADRFPNHGLGRAMNDRLERAARQ